MLSSLKRALALLLLPGAAASAQELAPVPAQPAAVQPVASPPQPNQSSTAAKKPDESAPVSVSSEVVTGETGSETSPTLDVAAATLEAVPGGTSLISSADFQKARVATAADALAFQPGVLAQSSGGQDAIKISIRGSGINRGTGFFRDGIFFEFDGLPITGPGGTPYELLEPLGVNYIEVLRSGNSFSTGALALGGTINYVSNTGYDAPGLLLRAEAGSFGYYKGQLSSGGVDGKTDYYFSLTDSYRAGFQVHSDSRTHGFEGNVGVKISPNLETRTYLRYRYTYFDNPGQLTKAQLLANPAQGSPSPTGNVAFNSFRLQPGSTWVGNTTTLKIDPESKLELGLVYHNYPIQIGTTALPYTGSASNPVFNPDINPAYNPAFATTSAYNGGTLAKWWFDDVSAQLKYSRNDEIAGKPSNTTVEFRDTTNVNGGVTTQVNGFGSLYFGDVFRERDFNGSADAVLLADNDTELLKDLWFTSGIAETYTKRVSDINLPVVNDFSQDNWDYLYQVGPRYDFTPGIEAFANASRSVEPANAWAYLNPNNASSLNLKEQTAATEEIGVRAKAGIFDASLNYYYSSLHNELQTVVISPPGVNPVVTNEANASPTIHQGIEANLDTTLWQQGGYSNSRKSRNDESSSRLTLHQAYTLSDFYYRDDPVFGHNKEAGLPENYYQAELLYEDRSGFYAGVDLQASSGYYIDYANTFTVNPYAIFGAKLGYDPPKKPWQFYLEFTNIGNKAYAASITPTLNAAHADAAVSNPGDGFGVFAGVVFHFF